MNRDTTTVTVVLGGRTHQVELGHEEPILAGLRRQRLRPPFLCARGECGTCIARVTQGQVRMLRNEVLEAEEVAAGLVLTCQGLAETPHITVEYL